jgi:hypothetical protein
MVARPKLSFKGEDKMSMRVLRDGQVVTVEAPEHGDWMIFGVRHSSENGYEFQRLKSRYERNYAKHVNHAEHFHVIGYIEVVFEMGLFGRADGWHVGVYTHANRPAMKRLADGFELSALDEYLNAHPTASRFTGEDVEDWEQTTPEFFAETEHDNESR